MFLAEWISSYGILKKVRIGSISQFASKLIKEICVELLIVPLTATEYHLQTNRQVKRYNATTMLMRHHYGSEYQQDCEIFVILPTSLPTTCRYIV